MTLDALTSAGLPEFAAIGSVALLALGLVAARGLAARPANAHFALLVAVSLSAIAPGAMWASRELGWGLLAPATAQQEQPAAPQTPPLDPPRENQHANAATGDSAIGLIGRSPESSHAGSAADVSAPTKVSPPAAARAPQPPPSARPVDWRLSGLALWGGGALLITTRLIAAAASARRVVRHAKPVRDVAQRRPLLTAARRFGLSSSPRMAISPAVQSPAVWCWGRQPLVLLPAAGPEASSVDWSAVFEHELAHWRRRDHLAGLLGDLAACAWWWNPLAWVVRRRLAFFADRACDEWVLSAGHAPTQYADALLHFAAKGRPAIGLGAVGSRRAIVRRIEAILDDVRRSPRLDRRGGALALAGAAVVSIAAALAQPGPRSDDPPAPAPTPEVAPRPAQPAAPIAAQDAAAPQPGLAPAEAALSDEELAARLAQLAAEDWRSAFALGRKLAALPGRRGIDLLQPQWFRLSITSRQQMLRAWWQSQPLDSTSPTMLLDVMHLGMTDPHHDVQNWAIRLLRDLALRDFSESFDEYAAWYEANRNRSPREITIENARLYAIALTEAKGRDLDRLLRIDVDRALRTAPHAGPVLMEHGVAETLKTLLRSPPSRDSIRSIGSLLNALPLDETYLRTEVLPLAQREREFELRAAAIRALGRPGNGWAFEPLREILIAALNERSSTRTVLMFSIAQALAEMNNPEVIPDMIAVIVADDTYDTVYGVGYFGLSKLTGVQYAEEHNGAWWVDWWERNRQRFPEAVRSRPIPKIEAPARPAKGRALVEAPPICIDDDEQQRYFLIGLPEEASPASAPADGYKLLVVLPGGDGGADFHPFVRQIWSEALPPGYLIAQAIAPRWRDDDDRVVWPTRGLPDAAMKFSAEEFVAAIIRDVQKRARIDARHVYAMGWSSGGPPVYACLASRDVPIRGAFVAMSVYKPEHLPPRADRASRPCYILHSPQDFIAMRFPEKAMQELQETGAPVHLTRYDGGHGWHGDPYGMIRDGVQWLETQAGK